MRDILPMDPRSSGLQTANRCGAEYNVYIIDTYTYIYIYIYVYICIYIYISIRRNSIEYIAYVCICTLCRDCTVLYIRVCIPDISKYGVCITDEYLNN